MFSHEGHPSISGFVEAGVLKVCEPWMVGAWQEVTQFRLASPSVQTDHDIGPKIRTDHLGKLLNSFCKLPYQ